jgi:hypothetical protein
MNRKPRPVILHLGQTCSLMSPVDVCNCDIPIVTGGKAGDFLRLLVNGKQFGLSRIDYTCQDRRGRNRPVPPVTRSFMD